jgi:hypothetical protein
LPGAEAPNVHRGERDVTIEPGVPGEVDALATSFPEQATHAIAVFGAAQVRRDGHQGVGATFLLYAGGTT